MRKGMFTKEIEEALYDGRVDLAVHSLKDLPTELADAVYDCGDSRARGSARRVCLRAVSRSFESLPHAARIGTSSLRRQAQLRAQRVRMWRAWSFAGTWIRG